jgi:hypothetical protein
MSLPEVVKDLIFSLSGLKSWGWFGKHTFSKRPKPGFHTHDLWRGNIFRYEDFVQSWKLDVSQNESALYWADRKRCSTFSTILTWLSEELTMCPGIFSTLFPWWFVSDHLMQVCNFTMPHVSRLAHGWIGQWELRNFHHRRSKKRWSLLSSRYYSG